MSKKQPSQEELLDKVLVGNFSNDTQSNVISQDGDTLILHPSQLIPYDRNPRCVANREYESIKNQLITQGLQEVMSVTQRPGMSPDQFIPARGFNTRLKIVLEIFEESSDARFLQIECRYKAWKSEADTYINHTAENEIKGDITFFDRTNSAMGLKEILEDETGDYCGPSEINEYRTSHGLKKYSATDFTRFEFTFEHLREALLNTLSLGLGPWQIDAISKLHEAASMLWEDAGETDDWDPLFQGILRKLDKRVEKLDDWSYDQLFKEVTRELGSNDTQGIERAKASLAFVLDTGRLPEKHEYTPFTAKDESGAGETKTPKSPKPRQSTQSSKPTVSPGESAHAKPPVDTPKTSEETPPNGSENDLSSLLEDDEVDPNDALIDLENDPLLRELAPEIELEAETQLPEMVPEESLVEGEDGSLHYKPDHRRYEERPGALEANLKAIERWEEERKRNPRKPLSPELQELFDQRQAWEAELQRNKVEAGRTRATEMRMARSIENFRPLGLEVLHHHGYASALRICREFFGPEASNHIIQPIYCGVGFYVADWPRDLDFEQSTGLSLMRLSTWYWLIVASGQTKVMQVQQVPQEIMASPFGEIITEAFDETVEGPELVINRFYQAFEKRVVAGPSMLLLQELMLHGSLNLSIDQTILNRVNHEINRRCVEKFDRLNPGDMFQLESRWDRQYSDLQIDRNDYLEM